MTLEAAMNNTGVSLISKEHLTNNSAVLLCQDCAIMMDCILPLDHCDNWNGLQITTVV